MEYPVDEEQMSRLWRLFYPNPTSGYSDLQICPVVRVLQTQTGVMIEKTEADYQLNFFLIGIVLA